MSSTTAIDAEKRANFFTILRNGNFRNLWFGQIVSQIGDYFAFLALMVVVAGFSDDPQQTTLAVSGMMISFALPRLLFGLLAGVFVDRWDRRRTMLVSDLLRMVLTLGFIPAFLTANVWAIYALAFLSASISTLFNPAKSALIPKLVRKEELMTANALSQTSQMVATLIGPALAGATFYAIGNGNQWVAFLIDSLSYALSALAITRIRVPASVSAAIVAGVEAGQNSLRQVGQELVVGLKTLLLNRSVTTLAVVIAVTMLGVGAVNVLWLVLLKEKFNLTPGELAVQVSGLDIAYAGGMIAASLLAGNFFSHVAPKWFIVVALLGTGVGLAMFGYVPTYPLMLLSMVVVGAFVAPLNAGASTLMQMVVPNHLLGRVSGGVGMVSESATLLSMSMAGVLGGALGVPLVFLLGGLLTVSAGLLAWAILPAVSPRSKNDTASGEEQERTLPRLDPALVGE